MDHRINKSYKESIGALEDLYTLCSSEFSPILDRVHYHLSSMKEAADGAQKRVDQLSNIKDLTKNQFLHLVDSFYEKLPIQTQFSQKLDLEKITLTKWNILIGSFTKIFELGSFFRFKSRINLDVNENRLLFSGLIDEDSSLLALREKVYSLTRTFLSSQCLLTFNTFETTENGVYKIEFKLDYSNNSDFVYAFPLDENSSKILGFPECFSEYKINKSDAKLLGRHRIIEITNTIKLSEHFCFSDEHLSEKSSYEIMHFPFLFRPISLIIPREGALMESVSFTRIEDTGSMSQIDGQEVESTNRIEHLFFDFFSLFNS